MVVPAIAKRFGRAVRARRVGAALTQERLAELSGLHPTYVGMIERGVRNPTLDVAARLARALKVSLPKLIEESLGQRGSS